MEIRTRKRISLVNYNIRCETLYDENKLKVLKLAFEKYDLEELQKLLNIKNNEY